MTHERSLAMPLFTRTLAAVVLSLIAFSLWQISTHRGFTSPEVTFTDTFGSGLAIVPASCPSSPHYSGDCGPGSCPGGVRPLADGSCPGGGGGGGCPDGQILSGGRCLPQCPSSPPQMLPGGAPFAQCACPDGYTYVPGSGLQGAYCAPQCPLPRVLTAGVCRCPGGKIWDGSQCINECLAPRQIIDNVCRCPGGQSWNGTTCVAGCTAGLLCQGDDLYFRNDACAMTLQERCSVSCSERCRGPGAPTVTIRANPALVRMGEKSVITWTVTNVNNCFVTGGGDSWTSSGGGTFSNTSSKIMSTTEYRVSCAAKNGTNPTAATVVRIIPVFEEN